MATKDISDREVLQAVVDADARKKIWPYDLLAERTGQPVKICYKCLERADDRGYLEWGVSLRTAWPTPKGEELLGIRWRTYCEAFYVRGAYTIRIKADDEGNWLTSCYGFGERTGRVDTGLTGAKSEAIRQALKLFGESLLPKEK